MTVAESGLRALRAWRARGFTMAELVGVMVMAGILSAVALPRLNDTASFAGVAVHDQVLAALRYAGKTAVSHRRLVCASFTNTTVTLTIADSNPAAACGATVLTDPNGKSPFVQSTDPLNASMLITPTSTLYFQPSGVVTTDAAGTNNGNYTIMVTNQNAISVIGMTGYVL